MRKIDWNKMSELGLLERINREICHPLGLAVCRTCETGISECVLVAEDGLFEYDPNMKTSVIPDDEIRRIVGDILKDSENE